MSTSSPSPRSYEFGQFQLDVPNCLLLHDGKTVSVAPKAFDTLVALVEHNGRVLGKEELIKLIWPDTFVEEINLAVHISALRRALGDSPEAPRYIATIPRRGYRFVAPVRNVLAAGDQPAGDVGSVPEKLVERGNRARSQPEKQAIGFPSTTPGRNWRAIGAVIALLVAGAIVTVSLSGKKGGGSNNRLKSIAVLPFKPFGIDDKYDQLGLAMADALITKLSNIREIVVRPTSVVLRAEVSERDPGAIGRKLAVDSVLEGRIQASNGLVRVSVQLIRTSDGVPLWAERFDQTGSNTFQLQDSISQRVADSLMPQLTGEEKTLLSERYSPSDTAHLAYIRGRFFWDKRTPEGLKKAIDSFNQAIEADPAYALAYAGLADSYVLLPFYAHVSPGDAIPKAKEAALKALEIDNRIAEAHASLAYTRFIYDWDWAEAESELKRSLELNPNYPSARHWYADYLAAMGRNAEAVAEMHRALELDPLSPIMNTDMGWVLYAAGRYDEAIEQLKKTLEMDPDYCAAHWTLGKVYEAKGMYPEAITEFGNQKDTALLGHALAISGRKDEALKILDGLTRPDADSNTPKLSIAFLYWGLGDGVHGEQWLEQAFQERDHRLVYLKFDPATSDLRSDQRFLSFVKRVGLP
jgi:DNA-binding winged helix-turn-helix (wHTH) protein/TolB-like protein/tetratricopeptide (TPR) repeat protein